MMKFIIAATLVFFGGVASVNAQSGAGQEDIITAELTAANNAQLAAINSTVSTVEAEELTKKLEDKISSHLDAKIQAKLNSQLMFVAK